MKKINIFRQHGDLTSLRGSVGISGGLTLTWTKSASPLALKNHSTVAVPFTSLLLLQEMHPSLKPLPATASVSDSTSAHAPSHRSAGKKKREAGQSAEVSSEFTPSDKQKVNSPNRAPRMESRSRRFAAMFLQGGGAL